MSALLDKRAAEWALWYNEHCRKPMPLDKRMEFQQKSIDGLLEILAIATKDIQRLEGRNGNAEVEQLLREHYGSQRRIVLPRGVVLRNG